jgi:hypothetical protein
LTMKLRISGVFALGIIGCLALARPALANELCGSPAGSPSELFQSLSKVEKLPELSRTDRSVDLYDDASMTTWTLTLEGHPAHPAMVCRRPVLEGQAVRIVMQAACFGPHVHCQQLWREFEELSTRGYSTGRSI